VKSDLVPHRQRFGRAVEILRGSLDRELGLLSRWIANWWPPAVALIVGITVGLGSKRVER
jgi:hypothetical protein